MDANPALPALKRLVLALQIQPPVAVAYSGGADSTALLLACIELWPGGVTAMHINHGLQVAAHDFEQHCQRFCQARQVPLKVIHVNAGPAPGQSPEDAARQARYAAMARTAREFGLPSIFLGHHADDQVETVLLALSRGAGLAGLAAMPQHFEREGVHFYRPLLELDAGSLRQWLLHQGHTFIDDPTNQDQAFTRNRIRARLLPVLTEAFPQCRATFARTAQHAAQAQELLHEIAQEDMLAVGMPPNLKALKMLSRARQANGLRYWLRTQHQATPSAAQLEQLIHQIAACNTRGHKIHLKIAAGHVVRSKDALIYTASL